MKYFIIHSGKDWDDEVQPLLNSWLKLSENNLKFIVLNGAQTDWISDATAKIRQAEKVIYVVGEKSSESPNIATEISVALREKKTIYIYKLKEHYRLNQILENYLSNDRIKEDGEVEGEHIFYKNNMIKILDKDSMIKTLKNDAMEILQDLPSSCFKDSKKLLEQYKIYVKTSEDLVKRKQNVNSFYVTLNSIILSAIITIICAMDSFPKLGHVNVSSIISIFSSVIGLVICYSWLSLLDSYSILNSSKMKVIIYIEKYLAVNLYDTEWSFVTKKLGEKKYKSFTKKEKSVAYIFGILYVSIIIASIILAFTL